MSRDVNQILEDLARRAGLRGVPPAAVAGGVAVLALALGWALWHWWPVETEAAPAPVAAEQQSTVPAPALEETVAPKAPSLVVVHVVGAVRHPGVYELMPGSRVSDAVDAAGGMLADAVQAGVNMARAVSDGEQIAVPDEDSVQDAPNPGAMGESASAPKSRAASGGPVNINTADATLLDTLPGVGPSTAQRILSDREANGPFHSVDDLGRVSGIGPKRLEQLRGLVTVQ